jgi:hypothetical protein
VVQGFGSYNCNLAGKDAGLDNTNLLRGLNADCRLLSASADFRVIFAD